MEPQADELADLRTAVAAAESAPLRPVRAYNRLMTAVQRECDRLAATAAGRQALSRAAARDPQPMLRLTAATAVSRWDGLAGATALEALIVESGGQVVRPMTMTAALAVTAEPGRTAALCLLNLDRGSTPQPTAPKQRSQRAIVRSALLDAAEQVYGLAMNGGLAHAYEIAGDQFGDAAAALEAVGASSAAAVLRQAVRLLQAPVRPAQAQHLDRELAALDERLGGLDVMSMLEAAVES